MAMRIKTFICTLMFLLMPGLLYAQDACIVLSSDIKPYQEATKGFEKAFKGSTKEFILGTEESSPIEIMQAIKDQGCKVTVAMGSKALKFLKLRVADRPIVFAMTLSPSVKEALGRNITGVYLEPSPQDSLTAIHKLIPGASTIGILYSDSLSDDFLAKARSAANRMGLKLETMYVPSVADAVRAAPIICTKSDVLWMTPDPITSSRSSFEAMLTSSFQNKVPLFALSDKHVKGGAIAALSTDYMENGKQAGAMAQKVLQGTLPSAMPHEYARESGLIINLKTAEKLGFPISKSLLDEAVEVYR
ncbi:MAG: ABC transporter substrate binding protein [Pseudomonadota bacterium]